MRDGGYTLHLDRIHLLERMVEDPRGINRLEAEVLVIEVPDVQRLCRECVRLDIDIRPSHSLQERTLPDVGIPAYNKRTGIRVDTRQPAQVLSNLLEIRKRVFQTLAYRRHTPQCRAFELLALKQTLCVLDEPHIVPAHRLDEMFRRVDLA